MSFYVRITSWGEDGVRQTQGSQSHRILFWERHLWAPVGACGAGCPSSSLWKGLHEHEVCRKQCIARTRVRPAPPCPATDSRAAERFPRPSSVWGSGSPRPGGPLAPLYSLGRGAPVNLAPTSASSPSPAPLPSTHEGVCATGLTLRMTCRNLPGLGICIVSYSSNSTGGLALSSCYRCGGSSLQTGRAHAQVCDYSLSATPHSPPKRWGPGTKVAQQAFLAS